MWLIPAALAALIVTVLGRVLRWRYRLGLLSLMLWGGTVMILVDHIMGYEGGPFLEARTGGLITSGWLLGLAMLTPVVVIWLVALLIRRS
ncbi:MAG: hypothetical protein ABIK38_04935 [candidate division WOR-3 bacterium]